MRLLGKEVLWGAATGLPPVLTSLSVKKARLGCRKVKEEPTPSRQKLPEPKPIQGSRDRRGEQSSPGGHMGKGRGGRNRGRRPTEAWLPGKVGGLLEGETGVVRAGEQSA